MHSIEGDPIGTSEVKRKERKHKMITNQDAQKYLDESSDWNCPQCEMNDARVLERSKTLKDGILPPRFKMECGCCGNHFHIVLNLTNLTLALHGER